MDRGKGKRRGRGGGPRGRGQETAQRGSPSPSPQPPKQAPQQQPSPASSSPSKNNSKPATPVRSSPAKAMATASLDGQIPDSPSPVTTSDSEFLTPVSSPSDLVTPEQSPEKQRDEVKDTEQSSPATEKQIKSDSVVDKQPDTPKDQEENKSSPENQSMSNQRKSSVSDSVPPPAYDTLQTSVSDPVQEQTKEPGPPPVSEKPNETAPLPVSNMTGQTNETEDPEPVSTEENQKAEESAEKSAVTEPATPAKIEPVLQSQINAQSTEADTKTDRSEQKNSTEENQKTGESVKSTEKSNEKTGENNEPAPPSTPQAPTVETLPVSQPSTTTTAADPPEPKRNPSPPPPLEPEVRVRKISIAQSDVPTAKLIAVQSATDEQQQPTASTPKQLEETEAKRTKESTGDSKKKEEAVKGPAGANSQETGESYKGAAGTRGGGGGVGSGGEGDKTRSIELEKSHGSTPAQEALLTGKPGYWGIRAGLTEETTANLESEDSDLTPEERRTSRLTHHSGAERGWMGFTKRQVLTLLVFSVADFFSAIIISLQGPFYPREAETKGASATEYGLVFGVFELVVFITSPIYGKYLHRIGPKYVFNTGIVVTATATILFGFLDRIDDRTTFVALSFVVRIIEAMGDAAFVTASFAIIAAEFPDSVATTFASLETFFGLGLIVGPTLGGALYEKGGFTLPFVVMGGLLFGVGIFTFLLMPKITSPAESEKEAPKGMLDILKVPAVLLAALAIVNGSITIGFLNSTLEPHIRQFGLNGVLTGLVFVINGGVYAVSAPIWGWVCDRALQPKYTGLIGVTTIFVAFLLIGPAPFIPLDTTLWLVAIGLIIHGFGLGAALVSSFVMALRESVNHGFADNIQTYGLTSALWTSSFALGAFVGPSVSGILFDYVGFRWATLFVLACEVVMIILLSAYVVKSKNRGGFTMRNLSESQPLLQSESDDPCTSKSVLKRDNGSRKDAGYGAIA